MKLYSLIILLICFLNLLKNGECGNGGNEDGNKGDGDQNKEDKRGKRKADDKLSPKGNQFKHSRTNPLHPDERLNLGGNSNEQWLQQFFQGIEKPQHQMLPPLPRAPQNPRQQIPTARHGLRPSTILTPRPSGLQHIAGSQHHSQIEGTSNPNPPSIGPSHSHRPSQLPLAINPNAGGQIVPSQSHTKNWFLNRSIRAFREYQNMLNILYQLIVRGIFPVNKAVRNYVAIVYRMWQIEYKNLVNYHKLRNIPNKFINGVEDYCEKLVHPYRETNNETILNKRKKESEEEFNAQIDRQLQLLTAAAGQHPPPPFPAGQSIQQQIAGVQFGLYGQLIPQQGNQQNISQSSEEVKWRILAEHFVHLGSRPPSHPNSISNQLQHFNVENLQQILNNANRALTELLVHNLRMRTLSQSQQQQMRAMPPNQLPYYGANIQPTEQLQIQAQPQRSSLSDRASRTGGSAELPPLPPQIGDWGNEYEQNFDAMQQFLPADVNQIQQERWENAQGQGNIPTEANEAGNEAESSQREGGRRQGVMGNNEQQIRSGHGQGPAQQQVGQQHSGSGGNSSAGSNPSPAGTQK